METIYLWNVKYNPLSRKDVVDTIVKMLKRGKRGIQLTGVNSTTTVIAQKVDILRQSILDSDIVNIDNILATLALRLLGYNIPERAASPDIFELFLKYADKNHDSVYFLGATQTVMDNMIESIRNDYPNLIIAGYHNGFYSKEEEMTIIDEIRKKAPTFLFLGLPTPMKETFIFKYKDTINVGVLYGVGGAFDCKGGTIKRAPLWMQKIGMEGIYRAIKKPSVYGKRFIQYDTIFVWMFLKEFFRFKRTSKK